MNLDKQNIKKDNKCNSLGHVFNDNNCKYCGKTLQELYVLKDVISLQEEQNKTEKPKEVIFYGLDVGDYHQDIFGIFSTKEKLMKAVEYLGYPSYESIKFKVDPLDPHFVDNMNYYTIHISIDGNIKGIMITDMPDDEDNFGFSINDDLYYCFWALDEEQAKNKMDKLRLILLEKNLWSWSSFNRVQKERNVERKQLIKEVLEILNIIEQDNKKI